MSARATAWQSQTKWLSDQTYYSERPGIWTDRVSKRDINPRVTDRDLERSRQKRPDRTAVAVQMVDRVMAKLPVLKRNAILPRTKWLCVELVLTGQGPAAFGILTA